MAKAVVDKTGLNHAIEPNLPYNLRISDFQHAMEDVYDFFHDINTLLLSKGLHRYEDMTRPAAMSGMLSDMVTASLARFTRSLVPNTFFNGHPDLVLRNQYPDDAIAAGEHGIEIKSTIKPGGAVDTHGAREQWMCVFVYEVDTVTQPATARRPMQFTEVYLAKVEEADFRSNARKTDKGTRTATLHKDGLVKLHGGLIYKTASFKQKRAAEAKEAKRLAREAKAKGSA